MSKTLFSYDSDERVATIYGEYDQSTFITLDDIDFEVAEMMENRIRLMEKSARCDGVMSCSQAVMSVIK